MDFDSDEILKTVKVAVIGQGYVGAPLAVEFGKKYSTLGFDINQERIKDLESGVDKTRELTKDEILAAKKLGLTSDEKDLSEFNVFIVTVPTPVDEFNRPDLTALKNACRTVGAALAKGGVVIFESTVFPGATEEEFVPILEEISGLRYNRDFFCGYSPERINPGDKSRSIRDIVKITSGSNSAASTFVDKLYLSVIPAGTHNVSSIRVAEAAKVIENIQRDVNISLVNEFALIFSLLDINTEEVLVAAGTKWNFLKFWPGLVGGHCIGVDPYYLTHKAQSIGYHPEVILAGRRLNDSIPGHVLSQLTMKMLAQGIDLRTAKILIMGVTFKENCPDTRNSKVLDIYNKLIRLGFDVDCYDPVACVTDERAEMPIRMVIEPQKEVYDGVIIAVKHNHFLTLGIDKIKSFCRSPSVIYDLKYCFPKEKTDIRL